MHRFGRGIERAAAGFVLALASANGKIASMPSPMNFSTWPPRERSEAVSVSNTSSSSSMTARPGCRVGDRGEAADIGVPQHGADAFDRAALDRSGMNAPSGIAAEIGLEQAGGDRVAGMRHHRERHGRQDGLQQRKVVLAKAPRPVGRERIADAGAARRVALRAEADDLGEIVGGRRPQRVLRARGKSSCASGRQPPAQM